MNGVFQLNQWPCVFLTHMMLKLSFVVIFFMYVERHVLLWFHVCIGVVEVTCMVWWRRWSWLYQQYTIATTTIGSIFVIQICFILTHYEW